MNKKRVDLKEIEEEMKQGSDENKEKPKKLSELLSKIIVKPSKNVFREWFLDLYEPEIEEFLNQYRDAKENARKK